MKPPRLLIPVFLLSAHGLFAQPSAGSSWRRTAQLSVLHSFPASDYAVFI